FVEFPAGLVNAQGQSLDQAIVLVPGNPLISIGIWGQTHMYSRYRCNGCASNTCKESLGRPRSVQNDKAAQGPLCTHRTTVQGIIPRECAYLVNGSRSTMVSLRSGPVETMSIGTSQISAMRSR